MNTGRRFKMGKALEELSAKDLMTQEIITLGLEDELLVPADLTHWKRFKTLPVIDNAHRIVGMVNYDSLLDGDFATGKNIHSEPQKIRVRDIMNSDFKTVDPATLISDIARVLCTSPHGCVAVTEKGILVGVISTSDLARLLY